MIAGIPNGPSIPLNKKEMSKSVSKMAFPTHTVTEPL
jgi:hypothetical protein